jgi:hypothetical protein
LTKNEASVVLKFTGKRYMGLQKLVYLYKATFLKVARMDHYYKMKVNILAKYYF